MASAADISAPGRAIQLAHERSFLLLSIIEADAYLRGASRRMSWKDWCTFEESCCVLFNLAESVHGLHGGKYACCEPFRFCPILSKLNVAKRGFATISESKNSITSEIWR
jgi:hypothetical protein